MVVMVEHRSASSLLANARPAHVDSVCRCRGLTLIQVRSPIKVPLPAAHVLATFKFLQAILTAHHLSNIQTIAKMSEEADAPSAMALALENSSVSYEDLADIEKEFDDAETEISKFESHACLIF